MDSHAWDERYAQSEGLVWSATPNRFLEAEAADLPPGRALDVACGEGRNALWLAGRGWAVTAVDFSAAGIATGRRRAREIGVEVDWVVADVVEWVPEPGAYDLVTICYLQLPDAELATVLGHSAAAVAAGGTVVAVGHDLENLEHGHGGPQDPTVLWRAEQVARTLEGLEIERAERVERLVDTDEGERVALDTLVRARRP